MNYYLIDYENVKSDGIAKLNKIEEGDMLIIFYSDNCKNISLDIIAIVSKLHLQINAIKVKTGTKNALDFQLSTQLGYIIGLNPKSSFFIISNDKGYDCICDYWTTQGFIIKRLSPNDPAPIKKQIVVQPKVQKPKKSKVASSNLATLEEIKKYLDNEDMPEDILSIFNQYKTKQAICNGISQKCKDNKRTGLIYKKLKPLLKEKNKS